MSILSFIVQGLLVGLGIGLLVNGNYELGFLAVIASRIVSIEENLYNLRVIENSRYARELLLQMGKDIDNSDDE